MSLGPVMLDLQGVDITPEERELLAHPHVGGVILFSRNFTSVEQLERLVSDIHGIRTPRLLIAVDHEGGRVQRFRDGFTLLPAAAHFGQVYDEDPGRGRHLAERAGWLMAVELRAVGIDFSFAPVLDVDHGISEVIGNRAFHREPAVVAELAHAYIKGMHDAGMAATGKHFPGHGAVSADSHVAIPVDERDYNDIYAHDILPFKRLIPEGLAAIMPAHVIYPKIDKLPAGFSSHWLQEILRTRLQFQGVIFSDDLDMQGASVVGQDYATRARLALQAGCDMVLVCNNRAGAVEVVDALADDNDPVAHVRLARMHGRHDITRRKLHQQIRWKEAVALIERYQDDPSMEFNF
ncbi:MAG: beta-N-acetylhexosaminidase [Proteobacteria bacterium]|jgi:beta-N-acetylhexosaminidase|nr:beta-N-acetylhexosaminidase [Pseudomonadota bacterium]MCG6935067.1 beta-N-acetylhexosaminidase [Pseudomonadota bacterium]